jgi:hypothetical protein
MQARINEVHALTWHEQPRAAFLKGLACIHMHPRPSDLSQLVQKSNVPSVSSKHKFFASKLSLQYQTSVQSSCQDVCEQLSIHASIWIGLRMIDWQERSARVPLDQDHVWESPEKAPLSTGSKQNFCREQSTFSFCVCDCLLTRTRGYAVDCLPMCSYIIHSLPSIHILFSWQQKCHSYLNY